MANKGHEMQSKKLTKAKPGQPTQRFLDIAEIREDTVVLKDGTMRAVVMISSINFALKSQDEQQAIIQSYMQFLNGLEHPIQIAIQSRRMNIDRYIESLVEQEQKISNELLKSQIRDYRAFVADLVELGEIMEKRFYIVVPFSPYAEKRSGFFSRVSAALAPASVIKLNAKQFKERRDSLMQRISIVQGGLTSMGLQSVLLDTQSLIELYYNVYNPDTYDTQKLATLSDLRVEEGF